MACEGIGNSQSRQLERRIPCHANVVGDLSVSTANHAYNVASVVGALTVNTANFAHDVSNVVALRIVNTCGLPARAKNVQCVIYVVP